MKRKTLIPLLIIALVALSFTQQRRYRAVRVYDGDTILVKGEGIVRYLGINAPEVGRHGEEGEYMALDSKALNRRLVGMSPVRLEFDQEKRDRHGRLLAYVYLENDDMVNALLIGKGLAHVLAKRPNLRYFSLLLDLQRQAMTERIGIWGREPGEKEPHYLGNTHSYRFHRPACPFGKRIGPHHLVKFPTRHEAFWEGFAPCKECIP
jgi:micrococcal nuclease